MKQTTRSVVRKLSRMKLRLIGISLVISMAMSMFVAGFYAAEMYDHSIDRNFEESLMPDVMYEFAEPQNQSEVEGILEGLDGIEAYDTRLSVGGIYEFEGEAITTILIGIDETENRDILKLGLESGHFFSDDTTAISVTGMQDWGLQDGSEVEFMVAGRSLNLTISGTVTSVEYMFLSQYAEYSIPVGGSLAVIFVDLGSLKDFCGCGVNEALVLLDEDGSEAAVSTALAPLGIKTVTPQDQHPSAVFMAIGAGKMRSMFPVMGMIFMIVGFISIFMTVYRLVKNDTRYIGVMMSLGYTRKEINRAYLVLGLYISIIGGIIGTIFTFMWTGLIVFAALEMFGAMNLYYPRVLYPFLLGWIYVFGSVLLSVWIPVTMTTKVSVREALDYKPKIRVHSSRRFSKGFSRVTLMGLRNSTRNPGRMALTIFVVGMTIGTAGAWVVMMDSAYGYMGNVLDDDTWDLRGDFSGQVLESDVDASYLGLDENDIEYIIPFSHMSGLMSSGGSSTGGVIVGCDEMSRARDFDVDKGSIDLSKAVVTVMLAKELGLDVGDEVEIQMGGETVTLEVSAIVVDMMLQTLYTEKANLDDLFPEQYCTGVFIQLTDNSPENAEASAELMRVTPIISKVVIQDDISETLNTILETAWGMLYAFFFLNIMIALVVAASAVIISTMERDVEFATLDTLGITRGKVAKSILVEMSVLAVGSALVGVPMSYFFGWLLMKVLQEVLFYFPIFIMVGASIMTFLIGFIFVMMSSIVPIRYANKLDTEKTLRERTAG